MYKYDIISALLYLYIEENPFYSLKSQEGVVISEKRDKERKISVYYIIKSII